MIEKQLIQALEPFISDIETIEKRIAEVELKEGPAGPAGERGEPGADADVSDVVEKVLASDVFSKTALDAIDDAMAARFEQEMLEVKSILE